MVQVTFVQADGEEQILDCAIGESLMESAVAANVDGILAECGGACSCATCHVILDEDWFEKAPQKSDLEEGMLEGALNVTAYSRLACQIPVSEELNGLRVTVPPSQF